ncbi:arginine--tRNA ligase [candidate division WWE3 bacterium CG08_land_8_20_14_0_20_40_13]|uniref:Arginine--tRNA ligase n=1 Tax=candidate division WWE3 bacterium CG08_land_8_20_14_0_20_40_13 TaxID=1975084 RepID=A0A2H0XG11_UNCKA|nr:MAG: arginine--tRNA ligase [candidate division WWE3 bacterium CG08_land_8_20_14_0_20_40_13]
MEQIRSRIKIKLLEIAKKSQIGAGDFSLEQTQEESFGDYSTNLALILAHKIKTSPKKVAEDVVQELNGGDYAVSVAEPGFINFRLSGRDLLEKAGEIGVMKDKYGENKGGEGAKINLEFVSANPTGPLHIGNARGGPLGDVLANVLLKCGYQVTREYYHNDLGEQVRKLGESVLYHVKTARGEKAEFPKGGYEGEYVKELVGKMGQCPNSGTAPIPSAFDLGSMAIEYYLKDILDVCLTMGIKFDIVSKESAFNTAKVVSLLKKEKVTKEKDGALWFGPKDNFLGDRECVLVKSDGNLTYFANDIAYHLDKKKRGFDKAIDIWGANHTGHIPRVLAAMTALGVKNFLEVILYQWVSLIRDGREVGMSKRKGNFVTAREVLDEVGKDAFRWFFLDKDVDSHIKFDIDLAKERSNKNPVFYVQYAHARMCSVMRKIEGGRLKMEDRCEKVENRRLKNTKKPSTFNLKPSERSLLRELIYFPDIVEDISKTYKVQELTNYAMRIADKFHKFYETCPIIGDPREKERLLILNAGKVVLENTLNLLGISAPTSM